MSPRRQSVPARNTYNTRWQETGADSVGSSQHNFTLGCLGLQAALGPSVRATAGRSAYTDIDLSIGVISLIGDQQKECPTGRFQILGDC